MYVSSFCLVLPFRVIWNPTDETDVWSILLCIWWNESVLRPATSDLFTGDEILKVNDQPIRGLTHKEAIHKFRQLRKGPVSITFCRRSRSRASRYNNKLYMDSFTVFEFVVSLTRTLLFLVLCQFTCKIFLTCKFSYMM